MHHPRTTPRIRVPIPLIPPVAGDDGDDHRKHVAEEPPESHKFQNRVLLVEDEFLLSMVLAADLRGAGYDVVGPHSTLAAALAAVQRETFDGAILDINLKGELVYPVAEELTRRGIPFLFLSGYALINLPEHFRACPRLPKPANLTVLLREVQKMLSSN